MFERNCADKAYRLIRFGRDTLPAGLALKRHRHREGYANLILAGSFVEANFTGRFRLGPGQVLLHTGFDCHSNVGASRAGLTILRLPWSALGREGAFEVPDPDLLVRLAEREPLDATAALEEIVGKPVAPEGHWADVLASDISIRTDMLLAEWAERKSLAPETVSRVFRRIYGTSPREFRLQTRARGAWQKVVGTTVPLTGIAHEAGFADLSHMSRSIRDLTGAPPSYWRAKAPSTQVADG